MDKRLFTRVAYSELVSINHNNEVFLGEIKNLSLQGMFITTEHKLLLQTPFDITLDLFDVESPNIKATVVRCGKSGVGLKIKHMSINSFFHLRKAVSMQCTDLDQIIRESCLISSFIH